MLDSLPAYALFWAEGRVGVIVGGLLILRIRHLNP
jgi:hypothetical protein